MFTKTNTEFEINPNLILFFDIITNDKIEKSVNTKTIPKPIDI